MNILKLFTATLSLIISINFFAWSGHFSEDFKLKRNIFNQQNTEESIATLTVDSPALDTSIIAGEVNWYQFEITLSGEHRLETFGNLDLYMILYEEDTVSVITIDDDSGNGYNPRIIKNLDTGWYKVKVGGFSGEEEGDYQIQVSAGGAQEEIPDTLSVTYGPITMANDWERFSIPLTAESFGVSEDAFIAAMSDISLIRIGTSLTKGMDSTGIDQIALGGDFLSTFDEDMEGWSAMGEGSMIWQKAGGAEGSFVAIEGLSTGGMHWAATPPEWSGDLTSYTGQKLSFYINTNYVGQTATVELITGGAKWIVMSPEIQSLKAGSSAHLMVSLSSVSGEDVQVNLNSSDSGLINVPGSITIEAGNISASVSIEASQDITEDDKIIMKASAADYQTTRITIAGDKSTSSITTLIVNDEATGSELGEEEHEWYQFQVTESGEYDIEAFGELDLYMTLYESDGTSVIAEDDDSGSGSNPKITANLTTGWYKVEVFEFSGLATGSYQISVSSGSGPVEIPDLLYVIIDPVDSVNTWQRFSIPLTAEAFNLDEDVFNASMAVIKQIQINIGISEEQDTFGMDQVALGSEFLSTFDSDTEGWSLYGEGTMIWMDTGGYDEAYVEIGGLESGELHMALAPNDWSGDLTSFIGDVFSFYLKTNKLGQTISVEFLTLDQGYQVVIDTFICQGESYKGWTETGTYYENLISVNGYDSTVVTNLSFFPSYLPEINIEKNILSTPEIYQSYQWHKGDGTLIGSGNNYEINESGQYYLLVSDENGCSNTSDIFNAIYTSVNSLATDDFNYRIIPNPNTGRFVFRFDSGEEKITLKLVNTLGQLIEERELQSSANQIEQFDISQLNKGVYHLLIVSDLFQKNEKIVVR